MPPAITGTSSTPITGRTIGISYPFRVGIEHGPLDVRDMFTITEAFDLYEVKGVSGENQGKARKDLFVDVLEVEPTKTTIMVTPTHPMPYADMGRDVETMLDGLAKKHLKGKAKVIRVVWTVDKTGIASDLKGRIHVVA
jgi:hypothetical protein